MKSVTIPKSYEVGQVFNYFFMSDLHHDSPEHNRPLLIRELDEAIKAEADIFIGGDLFSMLINGDRKRYTPSRARYYGEDAHINCAIEELYNTLLPYARNIRVILSGNHEETTVKFHGIDPTAALIDRLNSNPGVCIEYLGYEGYIRIAYKYSNGNDSRYYDIKAHHGAGGKAEVTFGTITQQRFMYAHEADLYWNGHSHQSLVLPKVYKSYMDKYGKIKVKLRQSIVTSPYVHIVENEDTKRGNHAKPMKVDYSHMMRTLQSDGGIMVSHTFTGRSSEDMLVRFIS